MKTEGKDNKYTYLRMDIMYIHLQISNFTYLKYCLSENYNCLFLASKLAKK